MATQARDNAPHYQHSEIGYNYRLSNICAGIGRGQMEILEKHVNLRRKMNEFYANFFKNIKSATLFKELNSDFYSNHWLTCVIINSNDLGKTREDLRIALEKENIESRPLWKPMHLQPVFEKYPYYGGKVSEQLFENGLCLPSGSNLNESDKKKISNALQSFFNLNL